MDPYGHAVRDEPLVELIEQTHHVHLALARRVVGNEHDAADVVQESYVRAWRALPRFRGDAALSTWLHTIIVNTGRTWLGRRRPTVQLDDAHDPPDARAASDPSHATTVAQLRSELSAALELLPASQRAVVLLKDVHGMSHEQIGRELGISETAAKVRLHRARRELRALLAAPPYAEVA